MAKVKVRYFVTKAGAPVNGVPTLRYFWQPAQALRELGWRQERLPETEAEALARAQVLNADLDRWRQGQAPASPAVRVAQHVGPGTLADLCHRFKASRFFKDKAKATQDFYRLQMNAIEIWGGSYQAASITVQNVEALYVGLRAKKPARARAIVTMLRILYNRARVLGIPLSNNPAAKIGMTGAKPMGRLWPRGAVELMANAADSLGLHSIGTAIVVNHWIGQREGDVLRLKRGHYRDGVFWVRQNKTGARVAVPHSPKVKARIEAELKRQADKGLASMPDASLLFCEATGRAWKDYSFRHEFARVRETAAKLQPEFTLEDGTTFATKDLWFMHLRHSAVTEMSIAGCTDEQIAGVTGHTPAGVKAILNRYLVRTSGLAKSATDLRLAKEAE